MATTVIAAAVLGVFIGVLSGLLGVGGGTIMVPMFRLAFGMSAVASTATSLFTIIPTSISGLVTHLRQKTCLPKLGLAMGIGGACTSPLGAWLANQSPSWAVMLAAALAIGYSAFNMLKKVVKAPRATAAVVPTDPAAPATPASPAAPQPPALTRKHLALGIAIGLIAGVISGYIGLGGGFLMIPLMLAWLDLPMKYASGTSLLAVMLLAIPGAIMQGTLGNIDYLAGLATAVGTVPGAIVGARLTSRVPERTLRLLFSTLLAIGAILLVAKELALYV